MTTRLSARLALGVVVLAAGVAVLPTAAVAATDTATLAAVTEQDPATGKNMKYLVEPGEVVPAAFGVTNLGEAPVKGLVVQLRMLDDLDFATKYDNCWYAVDSNADTAWCEFDDELAVDATLALVGDVVATKPDARADKVTSIMFRWGSKEWADAQGGVQQLAQQYAAQGTTAERGTESGLTLAARELPLPATPERINFAYAGLVTAPTGEPTPSASATATAAPTSSAPAGAPTASPAAPGQGGTGGDGGGLPVTGSNTATVAGAGVALLLLGGAGYLVARRRRTRFVA